MRELTCFLLIVASCLFLQEVAGRKFRLVPGQIKNHGRGRHPDRGENNGGNEPGNSNRNGQDQGVNGNVNGNSDGRNGNGGGNRNGNGGGNRNGNGGGNRNGNGAGNRKDNGAGNRNGNGAENERGGGGELENNEDNIPRRARLRNTEDIRKRIGLNGRNSFSIKKSKRLPNGKALRKMRQRYQGIPVYSTVLTAEEDEEGFLEDTLQGELYLDLNTNNDSSTPSFTPEEAILFLQNTLGHLKSNESIQISNEKYEVVYFPVDENSTCLAYVINYLVTVRNGSENIAKISRPFGVVNVHEREILDNWEGINAIQKYDAVNVVAGNSNSGQKNFDVYTFQDTDINTCYFTIPLTEDATTFFLVIDYKESDQVATLNCDQASSLTHDYVNGAFSPRNDAYRWGWETTRLYKDTIGEMPTNTSLIMVVHYPMGGAAAWTGSQVIIGDGDERYFYPMSEPDIVAHEIAHAFTEKESTLESRGQSGAIDESYSDMAAMALLNRLSQQENFQVGLSVAKSKHAVRDMCNPDSDELVGGAGIGHMNDYAESKGIHAGSGIYSKAFCTLSKMEGWSLQQAFSVFTYANALYWSERTDFTSGACGVIATANYIGLNADDVATAFNTVGIDCSAL